MTNSNRTNPQVSGDQPPEKLLNDSLENDGYDLDGTPFSGDDDDESFEESCEEELIEQAIEPKMGSKIANAPNIVKNH